MLKLNPAYPIFLAAILIASWPDGEETRTPSTNMIACIDASEAYLMGIAVPENKQGQKAITSYCKLANPFDAGFKPGWDCIKGFNCPKP